VLDFLEHLHKHHLRACNTFPNETHHDDDSSWTCLGIRKELRLIDYSCFAEGLSFQIDYKQDVNTDHRSMHTSIPLAVHGAATQEMIVRYKKHTRRQSNKFWRPTSDVTAASFSRKLKDLLINSITLSLWHEGLTSLVRDTPAETRSNTRPKKTEKPQNLRDVKQIRDEAVTPLGQTLAGKAVMKLERKYRDNCRKQTADWESLFGQRIDKRGFADCKPRHEEHVFSNTKDKEASGCIQN
jgi:hypothetical protein